MWDNQRTVRSERTTGNKFSLVPLDCTNTCTASYRHLGFQTANFAYPDRALTRESGRRRLATDTRLREKRVQEKTRASPLTWNLNLGWGDGEREREFMGTGEVSPARYTACYARWGVTSMISGVCWTLGVRQEEYKQKTLKTRNKGMLLTECVHKRYNWKENP